MPQTALGLIETSGIDGALAAFRAAAGASDVVVVSTERVADHRMVVKVEGDASAVGIAVEAGARAAESAKQLSALHVIPKTGPDLGSLMPYRQLLRQLQHGPAGTPAKPTARRQSPPRRKSRPPEKPTPPPAPAMTVPPAPAPAAPPQTARPATTGGPGWSELEAMPVVKLRKYARGVDGLPIQGREISKANKQQLLEALRSVRENDV